MQRGANRSCDEAEERADRSAPDARREASLENPAQSIVLRLAAPIHSSSFGLAHHHLLHHPNPEVACGVPIVVLRDAATARTV